MVNVTVFQGRVITWCDSCDAEVEDWDITKKFPHKLNCGQFDLEDTKIVPAEMMRDYNANLTGEQIAEKWGIPRPMVVKILTERGVRWKHPESRQE